MEKIIEEMIINLLYKPHITPNPMYEWKTLETPLFLVFLDFVSSNFSFREV